MGWDGLQVLPVGFRAAGTVLSPRQAQMGRTVIACSSEFVTSSVAIGRSVLQLLQLDMDVQDCSSCLKKQ